MAKYFIPIDRSSVKKNPNAGQTTYYEHGRTSIICKYWWKNPSLPPGVRGHIFSRYERANPVPFTPSNEGASPVISTVTEIEAILEPGQPDLQELFKKAGAHIISLVTDHQVQEIHTVFPAPKYFYEYQKNAVVSCCNCSALLYYTELKERANDSDWGFDENVCPRCGQGYCCELEFEKFNEEKHANTAS